MDYTNAVKVARMQAVITAAGSTAVLELCSAAFAAVLVSLNLNNPIAATPTGAGVMPLAGFPKNGNSAAQNKISTARIRTATGGTDVVTPLTVGLNSTAAPARANTTAVALGAYRTAGANIYKCVVAGTTGSSAPTGTGTGITDGSVTWDYYCPANAEVQLDNLEVNIGQNVALASLTLNHG